MSGSSTKKFKLSSLTGMSVQVLGNDDDNETKENCWRDQDASSDVKVILKSSSLLHLPEPQVVEEAHKEDEEEEDGHDVIKVECESPEVIIIEDWMMSESNHDQGTIHELGRGRNEIQTPQRRNRRFQNLGHREKVMRKNQGLTAVEPSTCDDKEFVMKMQKGWNAKKGIIERRGLSAYQDTPQSYACQKCHKYFLRFQDMWKHQVNLCGLAFQSSDSCEEFSSRAPKEFHAQDQNFSDRLENCMKGGVTEDYVFRVPALPPTNCKQVRTSPRNCRKAVSEVFGSSLLEKGKMGSQEPSIDSRPSCDNAEEDAERFLCRYPRCGSLFDQLPELHRHILQAHKLYACKYCESLVLSNELLDEHLERRHADLMTEDKDRVVLEFERPAEKIRQRNHLSRNARQRSSKTIKRRRSSVGKTCARTKTPRRSNSKETTESRDSGRGPIDLNRRTVVDKRRLPKIQQTVEKFRRISDNLGLCTNLMKDYQYQCNQCPMTFSRESSLKSHTKTQHGDGGSDKSNMSVASSVPSSLGESSSEVEEPFPMRSLRNRNIPMVSSSSEVSSVGSTETNASISSCPGFSTPNLRQRAKKDSLKESPDRLDLNMRNGSVNVRDNVPFVSTPPSPQDDLRSLSRPSMCNDCGVKFSGKDELTAHLLWHNEMKGQKKIMRGLRKTGIAGSALKHPDTTSEADAIFKCMVCGGGFSQYQAMKEHIMTTHTRNGRYKCMDCGQVFYQAMVLLTHCERKHDLLPPQLEKVVNQESLSNPVPNMAFPGKLPQVQGPAKTDIRKKTTFVKLVQKPTTAGTRNKPTQVVLPSQSVKGLGSMVQTTKSRRSQGTKKQASEEISSAKSLKYPCKYIDCGERFDRIEELRDHWHSTHSALMKFFCTYPNCGYPIASKSGLLHHMQREHKGWKPE